MLKHRNRLIAAGAVVTAGAIATAGVMTAAAAPSGAQTLKFTAVQKGTVGWSVVPSPNVAGSPYNELDGVSCVSVAACTAVGFYQDSSGAYWTLIESWNGTSWSVVPSPNGSPANELDGVSCVSVTACTAVGFRSGGAGTLVETWNGTSWSVVPSPSPVSSQPEALDGVSCISAAACTAVGDYFSDGYKTLVESWNGTSWSVVPSPNAGRVNSANVLAGVSCVSATACTAAGGYYNWGSGNEKTLVESWDGTSWSVVPTPDAGLPTSFDLLNGVSCVSAAACAAAGYFYGSHSPEKTLIESSS